MDAWLQSLDSDSDQEARIGEAAEAKRKRCVDLMCTGVARTADV
jgi:hypothetical protein